MAKFHLIPIVLGAAIGVGVYVVSKYLAQDEESEHIVDDSAFDDSEASESTEDADETELLQPSRARCEVTDEMLSLIDVLVDGEFIPAQHDISLRFRGSSNQRIIDLNATRAAGHTVLWQDDPLFADHKM